jgi:hypothetical protein
MKRTRRSLRDVGHGLVSNQRFRRWLSIGIMLVTLLFFAIVLIQGRSELQGLGDWRTYARALAIGFFLYPISLAIHAWIWSRMIARLGRCTSGWWDIEIYAYTHIIRRLPGAVWYLATRSLLYYERGVKASATLVASGLEWLWLLVAGVVVYGLLSLHGVAPLLLALTVALGIWAIGRHGPGLVQSLSHWKYLPTFGQRGLAQMHRVNLPTGADLLTWLVGYALTFGVAGTIFFLLIRSVAPSSPVTIAESTQIWALVTSVGTLVTGILPAGLGVNELTITALLAPKITVVSSLFVAILVRLLFTLCDLVWGGLLWAVARLAARRRASRPVQLDPDEARLSNGQPVPPGPEG